MGRPNAVLLICLLCLGSADGETRGRLAMSQEHRVHGRGRSALVFNGWRARPVLDYECIHDKQVNRLRGGAAESGEEPKVIALVASTCPDKVLALTNHVYLNTADIERIFHTATARYLQISGFFFYRVGKRCRGSWMRGVEQRSTQDTSRLFRRECRGYSS